MDVSKLLIPKLGVIQLNGIVVFSNEETALPSIFILILEIPSLQNK